MRFIVIISFVIIYNGLFAQTFQPDELGHVNSADFRQFIKDRGYELVGAFDTLNPKDPVVLVAVVQKNSSLAYIDLKGKEYSDHKAIAKDYGFSLEPKSTISSSVSPKTGYKIFLEGGKQGYKSGAEVLIPAIYDKIEIVSIDNQTAFIVINNNLYGALDQAGNVIAPLEYGYLGSTIGPSPKLAFHGNKKGRYGILSLTGEIVVPFEYDYHLIKENKIIKFYKYDSNFRLYTGVLDTNGKQIIPAVYDQISQLSNSDCILLSTFSNLKGLADYNGKLLLDTIYRQISRFDDNSAIFGNEIYKVSKGYGEGLYNPETQKFILPCEFVLVKAFSDKYLLIAKDIEGYSHYGLADKAGKTILEPVYSLIALLDNNLILLEKEGKYSITDQNLKTIIPFRYNRLTEADEKRRSGVFIFSEHHKSGLLNVKKVIVPAKYDTLQSSYSGVIFKLGTENGVLDFNGNRIISRQNAHIREYKPGIFAITDFDGKVSATDLYGNRCDSPVSNLVRPNMEYMIEVQESSSKEDFSGIYSDVDEPAQFPGGKPAMYKYIADNLNYPVFAREQSLQGKCYLRFVVHEDGSITDIKVTRGVPDCNECDNEAKRILMSMPIWSPAKINGKAVKSYFDLPINFKL